MRLLSSSAHRTDRRPGVVLLVVMAMLALFASLALTFVFYADGEAITSNLSMNQMVRTQADLDPEALIGYALKEFLYPSENTNSALRGHELARSLYGYNPAALNTTPFNSNDRQTALTNLDPDLLVDQATLMNHQAYYDPYALATDRKVNFVRTPEMFDKYFFGPNATPPQPSWNVLPAKAKPVTYHYVGGANPPWTTTEDSNSIFLAKVDPDGTVRYPSFYRPWIASGIVPGSVAAKYQSVRPDMRWNFVPKLNAAGVPVVGPQVDPITGASFTGVLPDTTDPRNVKVVLSYISPNSFFYTSLINPDAEGLPPIVNGVMTMTSPSQFFGTEVKNLDSGPGAGIPFVGGFNNDSYWVDMGYPVFTAPNGKRVKPMLAMLAMDLSNRVDLSVAGNRSANNTVPSGGLPVYPSRGINGASFNPNTDPYPLPSHASDFGLGASEINPNRLLAVRIGALSEKGAIVTVQTTAPHGFQAGDVIAMSGVGAGNPILSTYTSAIAAAAAQYNGVHTVLAVVNPFSFTYRSASAGLPTFPFVFPPVPPVVPPSLPAGGSVFSMKKLTEMQLLLDRRYGGTFFGTPAQWAAAPQRFMPNWTYGGVQSAKAWSTTTPLGTSLNFPQGNQYNLLDADGVNMTPNTQNLRPFGVSTAPPYVGFTMASTNAIKANAAAAQTMIVNVNTLPLDKRGVPYFPLTPGMALSVGDGATTETAPSIAIPGNVPVIVETVDATTNPPRFTAVFRKTHAAGVPITTVGATQSTAGLNAKLIAQGKAQPMTVGQIAGTLANGASWSLQPGMVVTVGVAPAPVEQVVVNQSIPPLPNTFTALFTQAHPAGTLVQFTPNATMPTFPGTETPLFTNTGYGNTGSGISATSPLSGYGYGSGTPETFNVPLGYNPFKPQGINSYPIPSGSDAILRFGGTNSPATLAELFRIMPYTFSTPGAGGQPLDNIAMRNKVTIASGHLDRIGSIPGLNFNRTLPNPWVQNAAPGKSSSGHYVLPTGGNFPLVASVITNVSAAGNVLTFTTMKPHNLAVNQKVTIKGVNLAGFNGTYKVTAVPVFPADGGLTSPTQQPITFQVVSPTNMGTFTSSGGYALAVPDPTNPSAADGVIANSDYISTTDWRSNLSQILRVDLNRPLTNYPLPIPQVLPPPAKLVGLMPTGAGSYYSSAVQDRQNLARDIYKALIRITGTQDPNVHINMTKQLPEYQAARWLAQLAVNIVDYIDNDDYVTPFPWVTHNGNPFVATGAPFELWNGVLGTNGQPTDWVFGTEVPRIVVNEIYAQQNSTNNALSVFAELHNPFNSAPANGYPRDQGKAYLYNDTTTSSIYTFSIANANKMSPALADPANNLGVAPITYKITFQDEPIALPKTQTANGVFRLIYGVGAKAKTTAAINFLPTATLDQRVQAALAPIINAYNGIDYMDQINPPTAVTGVTLTGATAPAKLPTINVTYYSSPGTTLAVGPSKLVDTNGKPAANPSVVLQPSPVVSTLKMTALNANTPTKMSVNPSNGVMADTSHSNVGYYVIGPTGAVAPNPNLPMTLADSSMSTNSIPSGTKVTYVLQRLANQHLPAQLDPTLPLYNPYLTVDFLDQMAPNTVLPTTPNVLTMSSTGRQQPFTGAPAYLQQQQIPPQAIIGIKTAVGAAGVVTVTTGAPHGFIVGQQVKIWGATLPAFNGTHTVTAVPTGLQFKFAGGAGVSATGNVTGVLPTQPINTFYGQNNPINTPMDWITHLDRPPVNVAELLHVSAYMPHQLTQKFRAASSAYQQYAPWTPYAAPSSVGVAAALWPKLSNTVVVTTTVPHGYSAGDTFAISVPSGVPGAFQGTFVINAVTSATSFTYTTAVNLTGNPVNGLAGGAVQLAATANIQNAQLYRALDLFGTPNHMNGAITGGRTLGRPNLNTINDLDVFQTLADSQDVYLPANGRQTSPLFTQNDVDVVANNLMNPPLTPVVMANAPVGAVEVGNTVTFSFQQPHGFSVGQIVTIAGVLDIKNNPIPAYNGYYQITSVPTAISFTVTNAQPNLPAGGGGTVTPIRNPYKGLAAGNFSESMLQNNTGTPLFMPNSAGAKSVSVQNALLQKIYNNTSTTSNTFAIFATIGFFEVVDETVRPPRLGAEIGRSQNTNIRHRFFAVVDRSGMQVFNAPSVPVAAIPVKGTTKTWTRLESYVATPVPDVVVYNGINYICTTNNPAAVPPPNNPKSWTAVSMAYNPAGLQTLTTNTIGAYAAQNYAVSNAVIAADGLPYICIQPNYGRNPTKGANPAFWQPAFQVGMMLEIVDPVPANSEVVQVTSVVGNAFTANFVNDHTNGPVTIRLRGNPGPQANYNPHKDNNVVLHLSVIK